MIPPVLLNALKEFNFVGAPLWRLSDWKDLVHVELTFHKNQPTSRYDKKRAESRRQPAPSAGEWPRQPTAPRRPPTTTTRSTPAHRQWRRHHDQPSRHCRHHHPPPSDISASHRQQRSHHHWSSCVKQHPLLLKICCLLRSKGPSRRSLQDSRKNTSMST